MTTSSFLPDFSENSSHRYENFVKAILPITIPVALQSALTSSLGMMDTIMLGHMGSTTVSTINVAAASQANRSFFVILLLFFGFAAGASIFFSQLFGKKDIQGIRKVLGLVITLGLCVSIIPVLWSLFIPEQIMGLFISKSDTEVLKIGADYISIIGLSYPLVMISMLYGFGLRSIGNARVPMIASIIALCVNAILNYFLIYGIGSIPSMGAVGAAIGTLVSRVIETFIVLAYIYKKTEHPLKAKMSELFNFKWIDIKKYFNTSAFVILEEGLWGMAMATQFSILGYMGRTTAAASSIIGPFIELSLVMFFAMSQGASIIIGNMIGEERSIKEIRWVAWKSIQLSIVISIIVAIAFGVVPYYLIPTLYDVDIDVINLAQKTMVVFSTFLLIRGVELVGSIGVLRGAGDTMYTMLINVIGAWFVMIPIVYVTGIVLNLPMYIVIAYAFIYEATVSVLVFLRIKGKSWIKNVS